MPRSLNLRADGRAALSFLAHYGIITPFSEPEQRLISKLPLSGATVIDIGANVGLYTLQLSACVGRHGRVIAFEPYSPSATRLRRILRAVGTNNVEVIEKVLTSAASLVPLSVPGPRLGGNDDAKVHLAGPHEPGGQVVLSSTLDYEASRLDLTSLEFVKCDVEGSELDAFKGGSETIRRFRPAIICEIESQWTSRFGHDVAGTIDFVRTLGDYRVVVWEHGRLTDADRKTKTHSNYIFLPDRLWSLIIQRGGGAGSIR